MNSTNYYTLVQDHARYEVKICVTSMTYYIKRYTFSMDGGMLVILHPFQQFFSHIRMMGG